MPARTVSVETMAIGKKNKGGKHWTKAELDARQSAAAEMERVNPIMLAAPEYIQKSPAKLHIWNKVLKEAEGIGLLDNLDADMLALYCDAVVQYERYSQLKKRSVDSLKAQQAWARIITQLSDKLGLNPASRARLIKKKADKKLDQFGDKFD